MSTAPDAEKLTMANTKKEMLAAYHALLKKLNQKRDAEMKPAEAVAEKKKAEARAVADSLSTEGIGKQIGILKSEISRTLNELAEKLESETSKYTQVKKAVQSANAELLEIYEIEKAASSLAALLEAQRQKREEFEREITAAQEKHESEMAAQREEWKKENSQHEAMVDERNAADQKQRDREQEEYKYQFARQKKLAAELHEHEKAKLEREVQHRREEVEKDLSTREEAVAAAEVELKDLQEQIEMAQLKQERAVAQAVKETTERLNREHQAKTELLKKEFAGEGNVLKSRIESLQESVEKQAQQIARLSQQLEHSYAQVQDIAIKAIEGSAASRSSAPLASSAAQPLTKATPDER
jgi:hypothetical protein